MLTAGLVLCLSATDHALRAAPSTDTGDLERRLEKIRRNPVLRQLLERGKKPALNDAQKSLLRRSVKRMSDDQIRAFLARYRLSTTGSSYARKERLLIYLGLAKPAALPYRKSRSKIAIENASEGEYVQGQDDDRGILKLRGRIRVRLPQGVITADLVIVDTKRREIYAQGNLVYQSPTGRIKADRIIYNQTLGTGIMYNASGYSRPVRFIGRNLTQTSPKKFALSHAWFTSCARELPHYNFKAKRVWIHEGRRITALGVVYYVGGVPILPLPFIYASNWGTGIITQIGQGTVQGWFMQNTYQFSAPQSVASVWLPLYYRLTLDWYQNTGEAFGAELYKFHPAVNYVIHGGVARHKRYEVIADFREKNRIEVTNYVTKDVKQYDYAELARSQLCGGCSQIAKETHEWHKLFAIFNAKSGSFKGNHVRNVHLRFENYSHQLYEFEYGARFQPESTIPALYENGEAGRGLLRPTTNWNFVYNEQWDSLKLRVEATRNRIWQDNAGFSDDRYVPANDVIPSVDLEKRFNLGRIPGLSAPVYWTHQIHTDIKREYSAGILSKTLAFSRYETRFVGFFSYFPYITFQPSVGYGAQKTTPQDADEALARESKKNSYEYWLTEDELVLGPDFLFLRAIYRRKETFAEEEKDTPQYNISKDLGPGFEHNQKVHETELSLETYPISGLSFTVGSVYDHRRFQADVGYRDRWFYPVARLDYLIDFLNWGRPGRENLMSRRKLHFLQLRLTDQYVYNFQEQRRHSNLFGFNLQAGGFNLWLLERLRYFEMGFYWYHVFRQPGLAHLRYNLKTDIQLTKYLYWEFEIESRAVDVARYADCQYYRETCETDSRTRNIGIADDIANGAGLNGPRKRQGTVFNVGYVETALLIDLHEWEMRIGVSAEQRSIAAGVTSVETVNFYDRKVFFSLTLLRFDLARAKDRPSKFIVNRRRIRSRDLGRTGISASRR